jgi:hypothetical protein
MIAGADLVTVANEALAMLGHGPLTDFNDAGEAAKHCNTLLPQVAWEVFEEYDWGFATVMSTELSRYQVGGNDEEPPFIYDYAYSLPSNCGLVLDVYCADTLSTYPWAIRLNAARDGWVLMTNLTDDVYVKYIYTGDTTKTNFTYLFWRVVKLRLAAILAVVLLGDVRLSIKLDDDASKAMSKAIQRDIAQHNHEEESTERCSWQKAGR